MSCDAPTVDALLGERWRRVGAHYTRIDGFAVELYPWGADLHVVAFRGQTNQSASAYVTNRHGRLQRYPKGVRASDDNWTEFGHTLLVQMVLDWFDQELPNGVHTTAVIEVVLQRIPRV